MAIAFVSSIITTSVTSSGSNSTAIDTSGANLLVCSVGWYNAAGGSTPTVSDNKGNTWTALIAHVGGQLTHHFFYAKNPIVGSGHTFSVSGTNTYASAIIYAFSGVNTVSPFDVQNGSGNSGTGAISAATGSVTPTTNGALVISGLCFGTGSTVSTSSELTPNLLISGGSTSTGAAGSYIIQTTSAAVNSTWNWTSGGQGGGVSIAVFLPFFISSEVRVSQDVVELISQPIPQARVSQDIIELISQPYPQARVSQHVIEIISANVAPVLFTEKVQFILIG